MHKSIIHWIANGIMFGIASWFRFADKINSLEWLVFSICIFAGYTIGKIQSIKANASGIEIAGKGNEYN